VRPGPDAVGPGSGGSPVGSPARAGDSAVPARVRRR